MVSVSMNPEKAVKTITIADEDYRSAVKLASEPDPIFNTAAYHCQQAAEKSVKSILELNGIPYKFMHGFTYLFSLAEPVAPELSGFREMAATLEPYNIEYRYSGYNPEPISKSEMTQALQYAESFVAFSLTLFPEHSKPAFSERYELSGDGSGGGMADGPP
jgi:HEPN domain-containing protein